MRKLVYPFIFLMLMCSPAFTGMAKVSEPKDSPDATVTIPVATLEPTISPTATTSQTATGTPATSITPTASAPEPTPKPTDPQPLVNGHAAILMDAATGEILYKKNAKDLMAPASTTKIMTAILALETLSLDKKVTVSKWGVSQEGTSVGLRAREKKNRT